MESAVSGVKLIAWPGWGVVGATTALILVLAAILALLLPFPSRPVASQLQAPDDRADLRARLGLASAQTAFAVGLRRFGAWCDAWFGPPLSAQAFERCLALAFIYPVSVFLISLAVNGAATGVVSVYELAVFAAAAVAGCFLAYALLRRLVRFAQNLFGQMGGDREIAAMTMNIALGGVAVITAFGIAFVLASAISSEFYGAGSVALAAMIAFALAFALALTFAFAGAGVFAIAVAGVAGVVFAVASEFAFVLLLFFVMIPIVNAGVDWLSWASARGLSTLAGRASGWPGLALSVLSLVAAAVVALALAVLLAALLANALEAINALFTAVGQRPFDWRALAARAVAAPWTQGLFVTGMILAPLAPVFVSLVMGGASAIARFTPGAQSKARLIPGEPHFAMPEENIRAVRGAVRLARIWYAPVIAAAAGLFALVGAALSASGADFSQIIATAAICSTSWSHGECELF
ncbi:MAG: hypothetical protein NW215_08835 [Hyphomicrobiales bacterium]|nr:hypothetical protein [Hyphomicrobiales bacterium]